MNIDPWNTVKTVSSAFGGVDSKLAQLETAKKALRLLKKADDGNPLVDIALASAEGDYETLVELLSKPENVKYLSEQDTSGIFPLDYSIAFNNDKITELILSKSSDTLNEPDYLLGYTPLMWAVFFKNKGAVIDLLNRGADPQVKTPKGLTVFELLNPGSDMYDFFEEHGLIEDFKKKVGKQVEDDDFYKKSSFLPNANEDDDKLMDNIKLQTAGLNLNDHDGGLYQDSNAFVRTQSLFEDQFDWNSLAKNQYIKFADYDITAILDLVFTFSEKYHHKTTYPAAVLFQCVRFADRVKNSDTLVENFLNLAFTMIRSNTTSKSGVANIQTQGDIVLQSYWLSVVNFLYYYLCRDDEFFKRYPKVLQDLVTTLHSLIIELTNSIKFRLNELIDDCLVDYTNIPEISKTLYKNDWNFFKKKHQPKSTYDEIYQMLYPPPVKEQLKPSPIKITQTLGALLYVLDLHQVSKIITQQTLSSVFYWLSCTLFNRVLSQKKYFSRTKAVQIRLNISVIEDWARSNNRDARLPDIDDYLLKEFPYTMLPKTNDGQHLITLRNIATYKGNPTDPLDLAFYHRDLFSIVKGHFQPFFELLQWLQCFTALKDSESLGNLVENMTYLNSAQLLRVIDKYRYEVDEGKFSKELRHGISSKAKTEDQALPGVNYTETGFLYLNTEAAFPVALPTLQELVDQYGAGLGGLNKERSLQYQPLLPYEVQDEIDEIHDQDADVNADDSTLSNHGQGNSEQGPSDDNTNKEDINDNRNILNNKDDELFRELRLPGSLVHRDWGDSDADPNPWGS